MIETIPVMIEMYLFPFEIYTREVFRTESVASKLRSTRKQVGRVNNAVR